MDWLRRNPLLAVLALVAAALAGVLALELFMGSRPAAGTGPARLAAVDAKLLPSIVPTAPEQAYPETANRPIFTPTRRPAPEAVAVAQPTFQRNQFVLLGVTIAGTTRIAMLRERASGRVHRIEKDGAVNGVKVAEIRPDSVTLAVGAEQEVVPLLVSKAGGAPGSVAGAAPAVAVQGPFGSGGPPHAPAPGQNVVPGQAPVPGIGAPFAGMPASGLPAQPSPPNPGAAPPQQQAPMTPEELLERRRARRAQQTQ